MLLWLGYVRNQLVMVNKYHFTVRVLTMSIIANWISLLCNLIHYLTMATDGIGKPWSLRFGSILAAISDLLVVYLLIFLAKGWTLVRYKISSGGRMKIAGVYKALY